jgi:ATP/maltotriose-dependent transcriptional regulator MalT
LSMAEITQTRFAAAEAAMERAADHAHRAGDRRQELEILSWLPLPIWIGPRPAEEGIRRCGEILERSGGDPKVEAMVSVMRGALVAMSGELTDARASIARAREILEDLGLRLLLAGTCQVAGWVDLLVGEFASAERELSQGYVALEAMGETALLSTLAGWWAQALFELGQDVDATAKAELGESLAGPTDYFSLALARAVRAKVLARQGQLDSAWRTGQDALLLAQRTDSPQLIGDVMLDLSWVARIGGRRGEATELARNAVMQFAQKGNRAAQRRAERASAVQAD